MNLNIVIDGFVEQYKGLKQRDANWYKLMAVTIGGSELASLMSISDNEEFRRLKNPYNSFMDVVKNKLAISRGENPWTGGGEACWWGILFEDVIMSVVEIELGNKVKGDDICVQIIEGHRNSPDGYIVAQLVNSSSNSIKLYTTNMNITDDEYLTSAIALLEFKCPLSRKPDGNIPKHYIPQLWSGLAVSNIASFGIFVDSVFRKCSIDVLGNNTFYDRSYHFRDYPKGISFEEKNKLPSIWELPIAWGIIAVYAPMLGGILAPALDLGKINFTNFNAILEQIDLKNYKVNRSIPWFADGRGNINSINEIQKQMQEQCPDNYYIIGYLPWKLFYVSYIPIQRRINFLNDIKPLIDQVHAMVATTMENIN